MSTLTLSAAQKLAERVCGEIAPLVAQVAVAGSIRRQCPVVGDIDLILLPHPGPAGQRDLQNVVRVLTERTSPKHTDGRILTNGPQGKRVLLRGSLVQCDLWIADHGKAAGGDLFTPIPALPSNWGALLLTYTGSKEHNVQVAEAAREKGWRWHATRGLLIFDGDVHLETVSTDERDIFQRLFGRFIQPEDRV